jgi:hypothetical protein
MNARDVRAFAERPWAALEARKREHWARQFAEHGADATAGASQALWLHMRSLRPDWPSEGERREDLAHHVALKRALDRVASAFATLASH